MKGLSTSVGLSTPYFLNDIGLEVEAYLAKDSVKEIKTDCSNCFNNRNI
ncbi:MAG: hypothetical protein QXR19_08160 [Candidatus Jordarchaeaceae archaeon]